MAILLNARSIAVSIAVVSFFGLSFVSWISGLAPFTCCKRALVGAVITYVTVNLAVKAVNTILVHAMIATQMDRQKEKNRASSD